MPDYFLVHDRQVFEPLRTVLGEAWRRNSFGPCRPLASAWAATALEYASRYYLKSDDMLLPRLPDGLPFDRACWRCIVGELLVVAACETAELPAHLESIGHVLAPGLPGPDALPRPALAPIHQALCGSRDLTFGVATYRPAQAGRNDVADVSRLAAYLASVQPDAWTADDLRGLPDLDEEEAGEELAFARDWFGVLRDLYRRCAEHDRVVVLESIC